MILLGLLFTCVAGWLLVRRWTLSFPVGAAALSLQLLLYNLAGIPWKRWIVVAPWLLALAVVLYLRRPQFARPHWTWPQWIEWGPLLFIAVVLFAWLPYERLMPLNEWDAVMLWMFKGKAFYLDGSVGPYLRKGRAEFFGDPAYPALVPLYATFLYVWAGEIADHAAKVFSPCFYASMVASLYYFVRRYGSRAVATTFAAMLGGLYMVDFVAFHYAGYADTAVAAAILMGAGFLYAWFRDGQFADFALAVLFASIAAWTKNEGQLFLIGLGLVATARLLGTRIWNWRYWLTLAVLPLLAMGPWALARSLYGVKRPGQFSGEITQTNVTSYWPTVKAVIDHALSPTIFNLAFPLCLLAVILHRRAGLNWKFLLLPLLVAWQLSGVMLVYVTGPLNLQWMIGSSLDRVLSQVAPLALLAAALAFAGYYNAAEERLALPVVPIKKRRK